MFSFRRFWIWTAAAVYAVLVVLAATNREDWMERFGYWLILAFVVVLLPAMWGLLAERGENKRQQRGMMLDSPDPVPVRRGWGVGEFISHAFITAMGTVAAFVVLVPIGLEVAKLAGRWWFVDIPVVLVLGGLIAWAVWLDRKAKAAAAAKALKRHSRPRKPRKPRAPRPKVQKPDLAP